MTAYMCCAYQWKITMENSRVEVYEDLGQDFGWESINWPDRVDSDLSRSLSCHVRCGQELDGVVGEVDCKDVAELNGSRRLMTSAVVDQEAGFRNRERYPSPLSGPWLCGPAGEREGGDDPTRTCTSSPPYKPLLPSRDRRIRCGWMRVWPPR